MNELEKSLLAANERRYRAAENPLKSHDPDHHWRVYQYALKLAHSLGAHYEADKLDEIVVDFWTGGHLQRKWESITTPEARELVKDDYEYARTFFERLAGGLKTV
jgi:hypothetical protein